MQYIVYASAIALFIAFILCSRFSRQQLLSATMLYAIFFLHISYAAMCALVQVFS